MGMNQAGLMWMTSKWVWFIHTDSTYKVNPRCSAAPTSHSRWETPGRLCISTTANSSRLMVEAGKKASLMG